MNRPSLPPVNPKNHLRHKRKARSRRKKGAGLPPGSVVYTGQVQDHPVKLSLVEYTQDYFSALSDCTFEEACQARDSERVSWLDVDGIHDTGLVESLGQHFGIHPLTLEDLANTDQRPKVEEFETYLFLTLKMIRYDRDAGHVLAEQLGIILRRGVLITFQDHIDGDIFDPIRKRIEQGRGKIRKYGADYLLYTIIDAVIDNYFLVLEQIGERVEALEDSLIENPSPAGLHTLYQLKGEVFFLRRHLWPLREVASRLAKREVDFIEESTSIYLRDVYDHAIQVIEHVEMLRDILSELIDIYLSSISHRMNSVMKVLTIITTIFMPLTFIAGIYGMNFKFMPELNWEYGYPIAIGVMLFSALGMLFIFRRMRWL